MIAKNIAFLIIFISLTSSVLAQEFPTLTLENSDYKVFYLSPTISVSEENVTIDDVGQIRVELLSTGSVIPSIITPNGQIINQNTISAFNGEYVDYEIPESSGSFFQTENLVEGFHYIFQFPTQGQGTYTIRLEAPSGLNEDIAAAARIITDSPVNVKLFTPESKITLGKPIALTAAVFNGQNAVSNASVTVNITSPSGIVTNISLLDNGNEADHQAGDGFYSAKYIPNEVGEYSILAEISGNTANNVAFSRQSGTDFTVLPIRSRLTGTVTDFPVQNPNDSRFLDGFIIKANTDTVVAGNYELFVYLKTANGKSIISSSTAELQQGLGDIEVMFEAQSIIEAGEDGPFDIEKIDLVYYDADEIATTVDSLENIGQTQAYQLSQMNRPKISLTGVNNVIPVDTNGNGKYEGLTFQIGVNVIGNAYYTFSGSLFDSNRDEIAWNTGQMYLNDGNNTITFTVSSEQILEHNMPGPYVIGNLMIWNLIDSLLTDEVFSTPAYELNQFEPSLQFTGQNSAQGIDDNGNGIFESLRIQSELYSSLPGEHNISFSLLDSSGNLIQTLNKNQTFIVGNNQIVFDFNGSNLQNSGINGPITVGNVTVTGQGRNLQVPSLFTTQSFSSSQFETGLEFAGNYDAAGIDTNSDGKYNFLRIQGDVNVGVSGNYLVIVTLLDSDGNYVTSGSDNIDFTVGVNTFTLDLRGNPIFYSGKNGPYRVSAFVFGQGRTLQNNNLFQTQAFNFTDFERSIGFTGNNSATGVDTNGNGKFEILRVSTEVFVTVTGNHTLNVGLIDSNGQTIETINNNYYLYPGNQTISFDFSGLKISNNGVDGPYQIGNVQLSGFETANVPNLFSTQSFTASQFESGTTDLQYVGSRAVPVNGDGDSFFEAGETADLFVTLKNRGTGNANNITATLTTTSSDVEIINGTSNFATIPSRGEKESSQFSIKLKPGSQVGFAVPFTVSISYNNDQSKTFDFSVQTGSLNKILYEKKVGNIYQVFSMNSDGSNKINLSNNSNTDYLPVTSPDGTKIVFSRLINQTTRELWIMNNDGSNQQKLSNLHPFSFLTVKWSPDSSKILFSNQVSNIFDLYLINPDASGLTRLTNNTDYEDYVAWSPSGNNIAYTKNGEVHTMNPDGTGDIVIHSDDYQYDLKWSPDGQWLGWIDGRDDPQTSDYYREIIVAKPDGTEKTRITDQIDARFMQWSPDSSKIAYIGVSGSSSERDLYTVDLTTSQIVNLTNVTEVANYSFEINEYSGAGWSSDGKQIIFGALQAYSSPSSSHRAVFAVNTELGDINRLTEGTSSAYSAYPVWENLDRIPPNSVISSTPPANSNGWNISNVNVGITTSDNSGGTGVQSINYSAGGSQTIGNTVINGNSALLTIFAEGITTLTYAGRDNSNNIEDSKNYVVKIDTSNPISQHNLTSDAQQTTVTLTASDAVSGVSEIRYSIDGGATQTYSAPFTVSNTGGHYVNYYAVDVAGNEEGLRTVYINPAEVAKSVLISEFRTRGSLGADDEFIELYNNSDTSVDISGWVINTKQGSASTPTLLAAINSGTVLPPRGHYLLRKDGTTNYSLSAYAEADQTYTGSLPDNVGITLFSASSVLIDAVGFSSVTDASYREGTGLAPSTGITTNGQYSFVRYFNGINLPLDSNNNRTDFVLVSTDGGTYNNLKSLLGTPGPENLNSPTYREGNILITQIDNKVTLAESPNRVYDYNTTDPLYPVGVISIRRKLTNNTGLTVSKLRLRITAITTKNSGKIFTQQAVLRALDSSGVTVTSADGQTNIPLKGIKVEPYPTATGGGMNSSLIIDLGTNGLANGESVNIDLKAGIITNGQYRLEFVGEAVTVP